MERNRRFIENRKNGTNKNRRKWDRTTPLEIAPNID